MISLVRTVFALPQERSCYTRKGSAHFGNYAKENNTIFLSRNLTREQSTAFYFMIKETENPQDSTIIILLQCGISISEIVNGFPQ